MLPSINLAFMLPGDQAVRFGLAKTMARARMDQLKATEEIGYDSATGIPGGSGGNPELDPWRAWAYDLSYEKFFAGFKGYVSAAAFYKDLESYIYTQTDSNHDYSDLLASLPPDYFQPGVVPQTTGNFTQPVNGDGGYLYGAEFAISVPFGGYAEWLDGFGAIFSYAYTESDIEIQGSINQVADREHPAAGPVGERVERHAVLREARLRRPHRDPLPLRVRRRSDQLRERAHAALRRFGPDHRRAGELPVRRGHARRSAAAVPDQQPDQRAVRRLRPRRSRRVLVYEEYGTQYLFGINYRF